MSIYSTNSPLHRLDLSLLKHFFAVASFAGFSKAARATGVSQPALSLGLKKLEIALNTKLIDRSATNFTLTKEGLSLFTLCQRFEANLDSTLGTFGSRGQAIRMRIRIGTALSIGYGPLVPLCARNARRDNPYEVEISALNSYQLLDELFEGTLDVALVPYDIYDNRFSFKKLWTDKLVFILPRGRALKLTSHEWKKKLEECDLGVYPRESPMRSVVDKLCIEHNLRFRSTYSANSVDALKFFVLHGVGGAFVLKSLVREELRNRSLFAAKLPIVLPESGVSLATRPGEHGDFLAKMVIAGLK